MSICDLSSLTVIVTIRWKQTRDEPQVKETREIIGRRGLGFQRSAASLSNDVGKYLQAGYMYSMRTGQRLLIQKCSVDDRGSLHDTNCVLHAAIHYWRHLLYSAQSLLVPSNYLPLLLSPTNKGKYNHPGRTAHVACKSNDHPSFPHGSLARNIL